jgi:hypothetical protein
VNFSRNRGVEGGARAEGAESGERKSGRHAKGEGTRHINRQRGRDDVERSEPDQDERHEELSGAVAEVDAEIGPYDVTEAPAGIAHLDLGALRVPAVEGVEVRVQADNDGSIQQVVLVSGDSGLQLGVFAAPRSEGIWDDVRAEIRKQLFTDGVAAEEVDGVYGTELRARVRSPEGLTDIRFVGVDGPRWLVRAVYQGPAAIDPSVAPALVECLENLVVVRGSEAMPVRDPLPLQLPKDLADQQKAEAEAAEAAEAEAGAEGEKINGANGAKPPPRRKPSPRPRRR